MNSYIEIDKLFGTPLSQIPQPKVPFKWKTWHVVTITGVVVLAGFGAYTLCQNVKSKFRYKDSDADKKN